MRRLHTVMLVVLFFLLIASIGQAISVNNMFSKMFYPEKNVVGKAYVSYLKCNRYERLAESTGTLVEQTCGQDTPRMRYECAQHKELLGRYLGYLDNYCLSEQCRDGKQRCRVSSSSETEWLQVCIEGKWMHKNYCYMGCEENECNPEEYMFRITAHPSDVSLGGSSLIEVEITRLNHVPMPDVKVTVGGTSGIFFEKTLFTDEYGQAIFHWTATEQGYAMLTAAALIDEAFFRDSTYVSVT